MLCPKCQHRNPDENRFCGQCGCDLAKSAPTIYPREGYDEADLPPVSEVEPEVPRFRRDVPPLAQSEYGPPVELPGETSRSSELFMVRSEAPKAPAQETLAPPSTAEDLRSFGSSNSILFSVDPREKSRHKEPVRETHAYTYEEPVRSQGIHGPSFLGLADAADQDFLDDLDEPPSHARRNWLLFALVLMAVLAFAEWRNLRQSGLDFAGVMKLSLPHRKGEQPKSAANATADAHSENGPASNGQPEMTVNPVNGGTANPNASQATQGTKPPTDNNGNATQAAPEGNSAAQQGSGAASGQPIGATGASGAAQNPDETAQNPDNTKPTNDQHSTANQKPATEQAKDTSPDNPSKAEKSSAGDSSDNASENADETKAATPAKSAEKRSPRPAEPKVSPGAGELARANAAGSPATAAKWLWASTSKGNLDAPVRLADMYANGNGVSKDCEQATVLLRSSARRGNPRAAARLGMYYATGLCVPMDRSQAWHWLAIAHQKDPNSDWISQYRRRLWSEMTPQERARAGNGPMANASD